MVTKEKFDPVVLQALDQTVHYLLMLYDFVSDQLAQVQCAILRMVAQISMLCLVGDKLELHEVVATFHDPVFAHEQKILVNLIHVDGHPSVVVVFVGVGWQQ